ncbi:MAG TPA: hypothetical protein VEL70_07570 [Candidatus Acidoferrum sp.]|nr:hypothetical protein [Candidatus Acidoferrum sp.]
MPKDLFRKSVVTVSNDENNNIISQNLIGYVAKDTEQLIVVFSEFNGNLRFDIPKSIISVAGNSVIIDSSETLSKYKVKREDPFPQGKSSTEEISGTLTRVSEPERLEIEINNQRPERLESRKHYKTPVQAPTLPGIEITETSGTRAEKSAEKSFEPTSQLRIDSTGEPVIETIKTQDIKSKESNYQTAVPLVKNLEMTESIHEKGKDTSETKKVSSTSTTPTLLEETLIETENKTKAHSEFMSQDKAISLVAVQSLPMTHQNEIVKEVVTLPRVDEDGVKRPVEKSGLDTKGEQTQELSASNTGVSKEALDTNIERFNIPSSEDYLDPIGLSLALWQDFTLAGINMYNGFAREFSKINEYWVDIFWNAWSGKKGENE